MHKKVITLALVCCLLVSMLPLDVIASESLPSTFEVKEEFADFKILDKEENEHIEGRLFKGFKLHILEQKDGQIFFQYGKETAFVNVEEVNILTNGKTDNATQIFTDTLKLKVGTELYESPDYNSRSIAVIKEASEYPFFATEGEFYQTLIAGHIAYIHKSSIAADEPISDNVPDTEQDQSKIEIDESDQNREKESTTNEKIEKKERELIGEQNKEDKQKKSSESTDTLSEDPFKSNTKYFTVTENNLTVYDNSAVKLVAIGSLKKGQTYPRIRDYGNWHEIKFGNKKGYVWKEATIPSDGRHLKNINKSHKPTSQTFKTLVDATVYDNTSNKLVPFAVIKKGQTYPIVSDYGNWYRIDVSDRIGYVHKNNVQVSFSSNTKYFRVLEDNLTIYDNSTGKLVAVGSLKKGQDYPRVRDYGNWHEIKFGNKKGYVWKEATVPSDGRGLKNINKNYKATSHVFTSLIDLTVYDNSSGKLVPFSTIKKGQIYPIVSDYGNWYRVDVAGRIGYVYKDGVKVSFNKNSRYFRVIDSNLTVYDNKNGKLVQIGKLVKGQIYPRVRDYGNWHEIKIGNSVGYVWKEATEPAIGSTPKNVDFGQKTNIGIIKASRDQVAVYDNTGKKLVPFYHLKKGTNISYIRDYGNWWEVNIANRIGYVHKDQVEFVRLLIYDVVNPKQNYSYNQMRKDIQTLENMYPDLIKTQIIGRSVDGRNIYALKLGKGKTEILFHGSHHAREHITTNLLMEMIDQYAQAYVKGSRIDGYNVKTVLNRTSIWFIPMVNPDGVMLVQEGSKSAKNPNQVLKLNNNSHNFRAWKANIRGVDLNRQYPADWKNIKNNTGKPGPMNYKGKSPLTEPEVKAVYNFTRSRDFKTAVAYHSTGEVIFWNFHQKGAIYTRDHNIAKMVGKKTGYSLIYPGPNPSGGGFTDWFILTQKKPALTIEVSPWLNNRPVPISYFDRIWRQNHSVGLLLANEAYVNRNKR